jgi:hypothetical protein
MPPTAKKAGAPSVTGVTQPSTPRRTVSPKPKAPPTSPAPTLSFPSTVTVQERRGKNALTVEEAKKILGWGEVEEKEEGCCMALYFVLKKWIKLTNNKKNRPINIGWLMNLRQQNLRKKWKFNGETIIIGVGGELLSGQHRLLAFILAWYEIHGANKAHWEDTWKKGITLETLIVSGVSEDDETFATLNSGKPATLTDFLYRSQFFASREEKGKALLVKATANAIRMLWKRVGNDDSAFDMSKSVPEFLDFLTRHPKLIDAVVHVAEENGAKVDRHLANLGYSAALLYLMATSESDGCAYRNALREGDSPTEEMLDFSRWDKACEFWVMMGNHFLASKVTEAIKLSIHDSLKGSLDERCAVVCMAWSKFLGTEDENFDELKELDPSELKPVLCPPDADGYRTKVIVNYSVDGIDRGFIPEDEEDDPEPPTPEEIVARREKLLALRNGTHRS